MSRRSSICTTRSKRSMPKTNSRWTSRSEERRVGKERCKYTIVAQECIRVCHVTVVQTCALPISIFKLVTNAECRQYLLRQAFEEAIHTHAFHYIVESLGLDEQAIFNMYNEIEAIHAKDQFEMDLKIGRATCREREVQVHDSSTRVHTSMPRDCSSDVCSSDLDFQTRHQCGVPAILTPSSI